MPAWISIFSRLASGLRAFYSWYIVAIVVQACAVIVVADSIQVVYLVMAVLVLLPAIAVVLLPSEPSIWTLIVGCGGLLLLAPVYFWKIVVVSTRSTTVFWTVLIFPYWFVRISADTKVSLNWAHEDLAPSGITYEVRGQDFHIGNGWNAQALLRRVRELEAVLRSNESPERTREG